MKRKVYTGNRELSLAEYCPTIDNAECYACWKDPATEDGYNYKMPDSLEEFCTRPMRSRLLAVILRSADGKPLGIVSLSPEDSPPDLAIMLYQPYRGKGYGTKAFSLAAQYCLKAFELECLYAGCYETNTAALKMVRACGFIPHPEGNCRAAHYLTGEPRMQYDFVLHRSACSHCCQSSCR